MIVLLDAGPLGMVTNPRDSANARSWEWLQRLVDKHVRVAVPEVADYEVRRELLRARKYQGLARLNAMKVMLEYHAINTSIMVKAAENWALARQQGRQSASDESLDADMILAAHAWELSRSGERVVIATTNTRHLDRFALAQLWEDIR
jgi:toxin FitB